MMYNHVIVALTGIILFLFSMIRLTEAVRNNITTSRTRTLFRHAVKTPVFGLLTGIVVTVLFQSSSASSVLAVGLVSSGLITFFHSLGIILGADIGTTLTVQFVVWKITDVSPLFIIAGGISWFSGKEELKHYGEAVFFFGLMFFGLQIVSTAAEPLKDSPEVIGFFKDTTHPLAGILAGLVFTAIVQSSAVPISILVILGQYDLIPLESALPIVFGANLGTAVTALLAGMAANIEGKRSALSHLIFKLVGVVVCLVLLPFFIAVIKETASGVPQQIALGHFFFNLLLSFIFLPILGPFSRVMIRIIPGRGEILPIWPSFIDDKYLHDPRAALVRVQMELEREMVLAQRMVDKSIQLISRFSRGSYRDIAYIEDVVDNLQNEIGAYLQKISRNILSQDISKRLFLFSSMVDDIERIADHAVNISNLAKLKSRRAIGFSEPADIDLNEIATLTSENVKEALSLMSTRNETTIKNIFSREDRLDQIIKEAKDRHLERYYRNICQAEAGPIFIDVLINLERISDHCENIAEDFMDIKDAQ
ncbi:MAG: Na/Pi cotransporter family protein [Syntrophales bacterium]|nr:Na/Pi cotransporter family protein [Syntrophales bacterium]MDY0044317.1 Na/Pi cotransporter family protein [Syntrophales bacterium]